ncbi:MAG: hypothetical protein EZS28_006406 [Streblomastix strix]|uniref:Uncharacterized protein n=1 Tax=Streblomastix strix TaxID=222440 RepID=A0A5J4WUG5_9EUKA|nr:MAG: hypothetical protein EZS28_006406 [Streblomastix strix]
MKGLEVQENATPKRARPMPDKTKDGDVIHIFSSDRLELRTDSELSTQQKADQGQNDEDLIEISDDKMNSIQLSVENSERTGKIYIFDRDNIAAEVRCSSI